MSTKNLVARDLYEEADNYLYYSKKNGRNKVTFNGKLYYFKSFKLAYVNKLMSKLCGFVEFKELILYKKPSIF